MESSNGVAISDEKQFHIHGPCIPSCVPFTPATPNQPNRTVRVHFITTGEGGSQVKTRSRQFSTMGIVNNVPVLNVGHQEAVCPSQTQVCSWGRSNVPFIQLLTCTDQGLAASLQAQIGNGSSQQHQPHSANLSLHTSQNLFLQMPQNGFPVQYINSSGSQCGKSCDQEKIGFDGHAYKENNTATDTPLQQHDSVHTSNPIVSNIIQDSQPVLTSQEIDSPVKNNEIEANSNIDLNKTPVQQKKRRRKHRPKVVVEGKAKRTPKPVTPKETNKEAPTGKRKYTRRAKTKESTTCEDLRIPTNPSTTGPISDNPGEDVKLKEAFTSMFTNSNLVEVRVEDQCTIMTPVQQERPKSSGTPSPEFKENVGISREASRKSCRRSLNFNLEYQTEHMSTHSSAEDRNLPSRHIEGPFDLPESDLGTNSQNRDCTEFDIFPGPGPSLPPAETVHAQLSEPYPNTGVDSTLHLEEELGLVTDKSSGLAFDLNCCYTQHDHCSTLPEKSNHLSVMNKNIEALATNGNAENNLNGEDNHQNMSSTKRESQGNINSNNLQFSKRRRTAIGNGVRQVSNGNHLMLQSLGGSIGGCSFPCVENTHANTACGTADKTSSMEKEDQQQEFSYSKLLGEMMAIPVESKTKNKWNRSSQVRSLPSMAIVSENNKLHNPPRMACVPENNPQPSMEALAAGTDVKIKKKRTKKEQSSIPPNPTISPDRHQVLQGKAVNALNNRAAEHFQVHASATYKNPMEEIIYKLMCLTIDENSKRNMAGALVPYSGDRTIVPYEGPLKTKRKQRPRARVDMDTETMREFNVLTWKEVTDSSEAKDEHKEKWWEEQRSVFRGRVDSFIARMHLVQGDRRFSPWKGSVVDSVVGVFLTQNVSDHLSSSAFMALAARFPIKSYNSTRGSDLEETIINAQEQEVCILALDENARLENERSDQGSVTHGEVEIVNQQFESIMVESTSTHSKGAQLAACENEQDICLKQENDKSRTSNIVNGRANLEITLDRKGTEDAVSPPFSIISSQNSTESLILDNQPVDPNVPSLESSSEVDYSVDNHLFPSFTELLTSQILGGNFQDTILHDENGCMVPDELERESECMQFENRNSCFTGISDLNGFNSSRNGSATHPPSEMHTTCCSDCQLHPCEGRPGMLELLSTEASGEGTRCHSTPNGSQSTEVDHISFVEEIIDQRIKDVQSTSQQKLLSCNEIVSLGELHAHESNSPIHESHTLPVRAYHEKHSDSCNSFAEERTRKVSSNDNFHSCSESDMKRTVCFLQTPLQGDTEVRTTGVARPHSIPNGTLEIEKFRSQPFDFNLPKRGEGNSDVPTSLNLMDKQQLAESTGVDPNSQVVESKNQATEINEKSSKVKKPKRSTEKKDFDWDSLRRDVCCEGPKKERTANRMDSLNWEAVRCADVKEVADTIRARGMNNMLAGRIKDFLNRVVADHGSIDLEWLRDVPPEKAKDYLLSIRGLGLKSVECVRLLTLHHLAFPVDTNVGRICVRLGWVPLQPLPESLQLHLLEMYPILETIQKYLWPRLCTLDQRTLYELHYQMITFGKVFCTKSKPNCNACPMRAECRHFASAFASARLALPGPEEKSIVNWAVPASAEGHRRIVDPLPLPPIEINTHSQAAYANRTCEPVPLPLPPIEINAHSQAAYANRICEPIIEEPPEPPDQDSPEASQNEIQASEKEIEDTFWQEDPDEIPTIKLNIQEFAANVQTYIEQSMELQDGEMSKALVALTPEAASIPMPKLKNVSRLRTEHQVYELPDSHPLLAGLDRREPDDPCSYLLAIWTPGETAKSTEQPETCCNSHESGNLCDSETCFTCNSVREASAQTVRGTLLIPCRTAMRGSFPLNGTYFQVNEVFADHDSSLKPIDVPRSWIWNLPRRTVYFGTSIPTIFRGLTTEGIQHCFWRGFVCVRGFDQRTRAPRPLIARLHFPASKIVTARKTQPNLNE